jgi:hypothetical protein
VIDLFYDVLIVLKPIIGSNASKSVEVDVRVMSDLMFREIVRFVDGIMLLDLDLLLVLVLVVEENPRRLVAMMMI